MREDFAIDALNGLHRRRKFLIKVQQKITNATGAMIRQEMGWSVSLPEKEREVIRKRAETALTAIIKGKVVPGLSDEIVADAQLALASKAPFDKQRLRIEAQMRKIARALPVFPWVDHKDRNGFSDLGLAVIVGNAGDLSNYPREGQPARKGKSALHKRLGLAPKDAYWDPSVNDGKGAYLVPRQRRSQSFVFCGDMVLRQQWRKEVTDPETGEVTPAHAIGPYGEAYARKKAEYLAREGWTPKHADLAARRYMEKQLLRDLLAAWRRATLSVPERANEDVPADLHRDERKANLDLPSGASQGLPTAHDIAAE
jgi:hypothetical protein